MSTNISSNLDQYLVFEISNEAYCINILKIKEIRNHSMISPIPNAVKHMLGVISLRGEVVPIFDFKLRFDLENHNDENGAFLLVKLGQNVIGLLVDKIIDILHFNSADMKAPSTVQSALNDNFIEGIIFANDKSYIILDVDQIFSPEEIENSKQLANSNLNSTQQSEAQNG